MHISKEEYNAIYQSLAKHGVLVAPSNVNIKHEQLAIRNLAVLKCMQSMVSRGLVREKFNWQYHYWAVTDAGLEFLRKELDLPADVFPTTYLVRARPAESVAGRDNRDGRDNREYRDSRDSRGSRPPRASGDDREQYTRSARDSQPVSA